MKKYIPITLESEPSIIGVNNGIYQCKIKPEKFTDSNGLEVLSEFYNGYEFDSDKNRKIESSVEIEYCQLLKKAYLTNFLSFSPYLLGCHFIVDERAYNLLNTFKLGKFYDFFPLKLYDCNGQLVKGRYYLFFQDLLLNTQIDFSNSVFYTGHSVTKDKQYISFNSPLAWKKVLFGRSEQIALSEEFDTDLDFFYTRIDTCFFVSEKLWGEIEKSGLIGIKRTMRINETTVSKTL